MAETGSSQTAWRTILLIPHVAIADLRVFARQRRAFQRFLGENRQIAQDVDSPQFVQIRDFFSPLSRPLLGVLRPPIPLLESRCSYQLGQTSPSRNTNRKSSYFPCYGPLTGNFSQKRVNNRGFWNRRRRQVDFPCLISIACNGKINFPVIRNNRAF